MISAGERPQAAHLLRSLSRLCDELIARPEESYRLWCIVVCDLETSRIGAPYIYDISSLRVNLHCSNYINIMKSSNIEPNYIIFCVPTLLTHHFLLVSRIRVKTLTLRLLMSYIYIWSTHS